MTNNLPGICAINAGSFSHVLRNVLQPGHIEDEMKPKKLPGDCREHRVQHGIAISQVGGRDGERTELMQQTSYQAILWVIDECPDQPNDNRGQHIRKEEDGAKKCPAWQLAIDEQRQCDCCRQLQQQREDSNQKVVLDCLHKDRIVEKYLVVFEADVVIEVPQPIPLVEAVMSSLDHRHQHEEDK